MDQTTKKLNGFNVSILTDLQSKDHTKIKNAFKKISSKGNESIIQPLIDFYSTTKMMKLKMRSNKLSAS